MGGGGEKAFHFVCWKLYLQLLTQIHSLLSCSLSHLCMKREAATNQEEKYGWWSHRTRYNRASGGGGGGEKAFHFVCWKLYLQLLTQIHSLLSCSLSHLCMKREAATNQEEKYGWWSHRTRYNRASGGGGGGEKAFHFVCWKLYLQLLTQIHSLSNSSLGLLRT